MVPVAAMSVGDVGPYISELDDDVWVPRTVPYLKARSIAAEAIAYWPSKLVYEGKSGATLYGFTRDCYCDSYCEANAEEGGPDEGMDPCRVPVWHFRIVEP